MNFNERYVAADAGGGGDGTPGDPWTLVEAAALLQPGDRANLKAGRYILPAALSPARSGAPAAPIAWRGYEVTIGDAIGPCATIDVNGADVDVVSNAAADHIWVNLAFTGNAARGRRGVHCLSSAARQVFHRCRVYEVGRDGVYLEGAACKFIGGEINGWGRQSASFSAIRFNGATSCLGGTHIHDGAGRGVTISGSGVRCVHSIIARCGTDGVLSVYANQAYLMSMSGCVIHGAGGDGLRMGLDTTNAPWDVENSIIAACGGYGLTADATAGGTAELRGTVFYGNGLGDVDANVALFEPGGRPSLQADPWVDASGGDFRLNAAAAALLGRGFPQRFLSGGLPSAWRNFLDVGAAQQAARPVVNPAMGGYY
jgi:hypothetical protein